MADSELKIGYRLQKARREKKIQLSLAARDLCIPQKYLSAFEKNDTSALPEPIYAVGFMRNYADYLGLDPDPLVETLKANFNDPQDGANTAARTGNSSATAIGILVFLGLAASLGYFGLTSTAEPAYKVTNESALPDHISALLDDQDENGASDKTSE